MPIEQSLTELKARALIAGFLRESVVQARTTGNLHDAAVEFAALLAMVTASDTRQRAAAKRRIKELATIGGWTLASPADGGAPLAAPEAAAAPVTTASTPTAAHVPAPKRRTGTWTNEEKALVTTCWETPDYSRDHHGVASLCAQTGRTPLAMIIRLFQQDLITVEQGDTLARDMGLDRLLSETNVFRDPVQTVAQSKEDR